jgi:methyltransferase (TIGR00027 family)
MDAKSSKTAVLVCQGRAVADGRLAPDRFSDPTARALLTDAELVPVERARRAEPPRGIADRLEYEMLRANAEVMVPRTVAIDDAVRGRSNPQLVILGAGLDGRAWRMSELADVEVFEVDHPASQADKVSRLDHLTPTTHALHFIPVDFTTDSLGALLAGGRHDASRPTTWIWEGVVPYLTPAQVTATMNVIAGASARGSRLIVNYQVPAISAKIGAVVARLMTALARRDNPMANEPRRSAWTPAAMTSLMSANGWRVQTDDDLLTLAGRLGLSAQHRRSLRSGRVVVADR